METLRLLKIAYLAICGIDEDDPLFDPPGEGVRFDTVRENLHELLKRALPPEERIHEPVR